MQGNSQHFAVKHIAKSLQATAKPKLAKELACPVALKEKKGIDRIEGSPVANMRS